MRFEGVDDRGAPRPARHGAARRAGRATGRLGSHELVGAEVVDDRRHGCSATVAAVEANPASDLLVLDDGAPRARCASSIGTVPRATVTVDIPDGLLE